MDLRYPEQLVVDLFTREVPEIAQGVVRIEAVAREMGKRTKVAVSSSDLDLDPVGACVGAHGARIQAVVAALEGEKIDIVPWDEDAARFVCGALAPAPIERILVDDENGAMELIIPDDAMETAVGDDGINLRLAARLTGWRLDLFSVSSAAAREAQALESLARLPGLDDEQLRALYLYGIAGFEDFVATEDEYLVTIPGFDQALVTRVKNDARALAH